MRGEDRISRKVENEQMLCQTQISPFEECVMIFLFVVFRTPSNLDPDGDSGRDDVISWEMEPYGAQ